MRAVKLVIISARHIKGAGTDAGGSNSSPSTRDNNYFSLSLPPSVISSRLPAPAGTGQALSTTD